MLAKFLKIEKKRKEKMSVDRLQIPAQTEVIFLVRVSYVFRNLYLTTKGEKFSRLISDKPRFRVEGVRISCQDSESRFLVGISSKDVDLEFRFGNCSILTKAYMPTLPDYPGVSRIRH